MKRYQSGTINILAIVGGAAAVIILVMGFALKYVYDQNGELMKKNGELAGQVKTVSDANAELGRQLNLKEALGATAVKKSEAYEEEIKTLKKESEVQKRALPRVIVKERDTKPTIEQSENSAKRLDVLWVAYCGQADDSPLCSVNKPKEGTA